MKSQRFFLTFLVASFFTSFFMIQSVKASEFVEGGIFPSFKARGTISEIINIGKEFWPIIKSGRATHHIKSSKAHAIPTSAKNWHDLYGWRSYDNPVKVVLDIRGLLGTREALVIGHLFFDYGGSINGHGQYLKNIQFIHKKIKVDYGNNLDVEIQFSEPANIGTKDRPVASIRATLTWTSTAPLNHHSGSRTFEIRGDGGFRELD